MHKDLCTPPQNPMSMGDKMAHHDHGIKAGEDIVKKMSEGKKKHKKGKK